MKAREVEYTYDPSKFYSGSGGKEKNEKKGNDSDEDEIEIYLNFKKEEKVDEDDIFSPGRSLGLERVIKVQK